MAHYRPTPDLGKAVLMGLSIGRPLTARQVHDRVIVYSWNADISMSSVVSRLELLIEQGLVEKSHAPNGASQYRLKVDLRFT
jgi:Fe2+ or Zn2+ uptake regulation protein